MGDVHNFFQQTPFSVKESITNNAHIEYDVRYILYKWKKCRKPTRIEHIALVEANRALFEPKDSLRVKNDKKRTRDIAMATPVKSDTETKEEKKKTKKRKHTKEDAASAITVIPLQKKEYEVRNEKYRRVYVDEYVDVTRYPLGTDKDCITFDARSIDMLVNNAVADVSRKPATYKWDPTAKIIKPWMIATSMIRLRRQIVQRMIKKYNLCFESRDFDAIHRFITKNNEAADEVRRHFDMFTWSYSVFNILTMRGFIPDHIDDAISSKVSVSI